MASNNGFFSSFATSFLNTGAEKMADRARHQEEIDKYRQQKLMELDVQRQLYDYQKTRDIEDLQQKQKLAEVGFNSINQTPDAVINAPKGNLNPALAPVPAGAQGSTDDNSQPFPASGPVDASNGETTDPTSGQTITTPNAPSTPPMPMPTGPAQTPIPVNLPPLSPVLSQSVQPNTDPVAKMNTESPAPGVGKYDPTKDPKVQSEAKEAYNAAFLKNGDFNAARKAAQTVYDAAKKDSPQYKAQQSMDEKLASYNLAVTQGADPTLAKEQYLGKAFGNSEKPWPGGTDGAERAAAYGVPYHEDKSFTKLSAAQQNSRYTTDQKLLDKDRDKYSAASQREDDASQILTLLPEVDTGGIYALPGATSFRTAIDSNAALFEKAATRLALSTRPAGYSRVTNFDLQMFQKALPNLKIPSETNYVIAGGIYAQAKNEQSYIAAEQAYLDGHGHFDRTMFNRDWDNYLDANPIFDPNSHQAPILNHNRMEFSAWVAAGMPKANEKAPTSEPSGTEQKSNDFSHLWN